MFLRCQNRSSWLTATAAGTIWTTWQMRGKLLPTFPTKKVRGERGFACRSPTLAYLHCCIIRPTNKHRWSMPKGTAAVHKVCVLCCLLYLLSSSCIPCTNCLVWGGWQDPLTVCCPLHFKDSILMACYGKEQYQIGSNWRFYSAKQDPNHTFQNHVVFTLPVCPPQENVFIIGARCQNIAIWVESACENFIRMAL